MTTSPRQIDRENDPITLADAAQHFRLSKGVLKAQGLAGRLAIYKLGRQYYTTPNAVRDWIELCRVERKAPASTLTRNERIGLLETDHGLSAQDALRIELSRHRSS